MTSASISPAQILPTDGPIRAARYCAELIKPAGVTARGTGTGLTLARAQMRRMWP
jgi:hypothetical protein